MLVNLTLVLFFAVFAFFFAILINFLLLRFSRNFGMRHLDEKTIRWATAQRPAMGGISFYIIFLLSIIFYTQFINPSSVFRDIQFIGILSAVSLGFLMGLADDAYNTKPFLKFIVQFLCGLLLVLTGTIITLTPWWWANAFLTLFWMVGIMNSINMLDNMDSITTGVSIFIVMTCMIVFLKNHSLSSIYFLMLISVFAALVAFLKFNWHPSKMFMGDTGSQFLGAFLGAMGVLLLWNAPPNETINPIKQILLIALAFLLPLVDTTTVTINRLLKGKSPFVGGKDHTTHHLSYIGFTDRQVALIFIGISAISLSIIAFIVLNNIQLTISWYVFLITYCLLVFAILYSITRFSKPKNS